MKYIVKTTTLSAMAIFASLNISANADENLWMYTKGTDTRPEGSWELKLNSISRLGKDIGDYAFHDIRPELEYGITDKLTVFGELMLFSHDYDIPEGREELDPTVGQFSKTQYGGFELGMKYNVLSPYKDPIGLSFGLAFEHRDVYRLDGSDIDQDAVAPSIYLQKNWLDNQLTLAFAGKVELERRKGGAGTDEEVLEEEIAFDLGLGIAYRFAPKWTAGLEWRYQTDFVNPVINGVPDDGKPDVQTGDFSSFDDIQLGSQFQYGHYFGPSLHYAEEGWWVTGSILWLVKSGGDASRNGAVAELGKAYDEHEELHVGVTVGFEF
ncbi:MAG: DUF6662 family protein [Rubritalea sp.]|uniref:DUF6662 family protein n=1 Tax=Rubritalea sp. TaxID=2109375 RepID=UPI003241F422